MSGRQAGRCFAVALPAVASQRLLATWRPVRCARMRASQQQQQPWISWPNARSWPRQLQQPDVVQHVWEQLIARIARLHQQQRPQGTRQQLAPSTTALTAANVPLYVSVVPAAVLALQPMLQAPHAHPAAGVWWQGPLRDLFSFTVLLSVFIGSEPAAAVASALSAAGAALTLLVGGPSVPPPAACTAVLLAAAAVAVVCAASRQQLRSAAAAHNLMEGGSADGGSASRDDGDGAGAAGSAGQGASRLVQAIQAVLGALGGGLLLQLAASTCGAGTGADGSAWLRAVAVGAAGVALLAWLLRPQCSDSPGLQQLLEDWPAWSATLLLILQPLQRLVAMPWHAGTLLQGGAAELAQLVLLVLAPALMVPRALLARQFMWFTGTCSSAMLYAGHAALLGAMKVEVSCGCAGVSHAHGCSTAAGWSHAALGGTGASAVVCAAAAVWLLLTAAVLRSGWAYMDAQDAAAAAPAAAAACAATLQGRSR